MFKAEPHGCPRCYVCALQTAADNELRAPLPSNDAGVHISPTALGLRRVLVGGVVVRVRICQWVDRVLFL